MSEADTPMTTQREVRQRKRGLYWLIALVALISGLGMTSQASKGRRLMRPPLRA